MAFCTDLRMTHSTLSLPMPMRVWFWIRCERMGITTCYHRGFLYRHIVAFFIEKGTVQLVILATQMRNLDAVLSVLPR